MLKEIRVLKSHGSQYIKNLRIQPVSARFRGRPEVSGRITREEITSAASICPVNAISSNTGSVDLGKCIFCNECSFLLPEKISFTNDYRIACNSRESLIIKPGVKDPVRLSDDLIRKDIRRFFRGALKLRHVSAASDNSCEMELNACGNVNFDMGRYGIEFVASPRHADGIVITGPISENMSEALEIAFNAVPEPKILILAGSDAISGGLFEGSPALNRTFPEVNKADLYIPGNPVHPLTFINGIMDLLGKK